MTEPIIGWGLFINDPVIKENRLVGVYMDPADANADALQLQNASTFVTVEPFEIQTEARYVSHGPALEEAAVDFDTPIHISGEVQ